MKPTQSGFTLVEIAIVLLIVTILLGYTVALFPQQQQLKQYRALNLEMDRVMEAIIGFAQVNGRLPCPALPNSAGNEDYDDGSDASLPDGCFNYGGFVPVNTLGLSGRLNEDSLMLDPWGNPYRYYVTDSDSNANELSDFIVPGEMRNIGLVNETRCLRDYLELDGRYMICDATGTAVNNNCVGANVVFGDFCDDFDWWDMRYAGAPFVLLSQGKNWNEAAAAGDELENSGNTLTTAFTPPIPNGPSGTPYLLKKVNGAATETTFVKRTTGFADDFDDVVRWVSPSVLYSRMIQAGQLP